MEPLQILSASGPILANRFATLIGLRHDCPLTGSIPVVGDYLSSIRDYLPQLGLLA